MYIAAPALKAHVSPHKLWVKIDSAREEYQRAIGAHPDQSKASLSWEALHTPTSVLQSLGVSSRRYLVNTTKSMNA